MFPILRELQASHPDGVEGTIMGINHVPRSKSEIKAKTKMHYVGFIEVGGGAYHDVFDCDMNKEPAKGDKVKIAWTTTSEGDGMPVLSAL